MDLVSCPTGVLTISEQNHPLTFSLILPTYNEAENIGEIVKILSLLLDEMIPGEYELIVVDDDSPDFTWKLAQDLTLSYPQLRVLRREDEKGLSTAVIRGWQIARGEILGVIDADLQHPPEILLQLWEQMATGVDLAVASRHIEGGGVSQWSLMRRFLSRGAQLLGLIILPEVMGRLSDPMSGYFLVRRDAIVNRLFNPSGYKILIEVVARGKIASIAEVAYVFREREAGASKVTWKQYLEYIQHLCKLRLFLWYMSRFVRFGVVGFTGVFVDMTILYLLSDPTTLNLPLTFSKIVASELAIINNFVWNDIWTFGDISQKQRGIRQRLRRLAKFNLICLGGLVLNVFLLQVLLNLNINTYVANLIAIVLVAFVNFWFNLKLSWRVTDAGK